MARSGSAFVHLLILHLIETMLGAFLTMFNLCVASCVLQVASCKALFITISVPD